MANGDLDGDTYFVCWDPKMIEYLPPQNFVSPVEVISHKSIPEVVENKISAKICWYYEEDILGQVNNLHLAYCDFKGRKSPHEEDSLELA